MIKVPIEPSDPQAINRAVFLDRDGTIIRDLNYLGDPERVEILPGVPQALRRLSDLHFRLVVVSNQSGVARGLFTEADVRAVNKKIDGLFLAENVRFDAHYYCPHHPDFGAGEYRRHCHCRKPEPGMLLTAAHELHINLNRSYMIGDKLSDVIAGQVAGCTSVLITDEENPDDPRLAARDLPAAVEILLARERTGK